MTRKVALNMHQPGPAFEHLLRRVKAGEFGLVVIDTLRRVSGAADGNSSEMGAVVDNIDRIKLATVDGSTLTLAHTDKGDNDTRGFSGIEDDIDCVWHAKREEPSTVVVLTNRKMKEGLEHARIPLAAHSVAGSLVLRSATEGAEGDSPMGAQVRVLDYLKYGTVEGGATAAAIRSETGLSKSTVTWALKELVDAGHVANTGTRRSPFYEPATASAEQS